MTFGGIDSSHKSVDPGRAGAGRSIEGYVVKYLSGLHRHDPELCREAGGSEGLALLARDRQFTCGVTALMEELGRIGVLARAHWQPLVACAVVGMTLGRIRCMSIASHALQRGTPVLRDKPQYLRVRELARVLEALAESPRVERVFGRLGVSFEYVAVLADVDPAFGDTEWQSTWRDNLEMLGRSSGVPSVRLSELGAGLYHDVLANPDRIANAGRLDAEIREYEREEGKMLDFGARQGFVGRQMRSYVATGVVLEQAMPWTILLDVQKRRYPFEQPFYSFARKRELPIVYCGY